MISYNEFPMDWIRCHAESSQIFENFKLASHNLIRFLYFPFKTVNLNLAEQVHGLGFQSMESVANFKE